MGIQELPERGHPELRAGLPPHPHKFGSRQMRALSALCDTFVPSLPLEASGLPLDVKYGEEIRAKSSSDDIAAFYRLSASDLGVPLGVAGLFFLRIKVAELALLKWVFWLLSTRLGTFLLSGTRSIASQFPYLQSFPDLPQSRREQIVTGWSSSPLSNLQKLSKLVRGYTMFVYYSTVDAAGWNPAWNAIGYSGPRLEYAKSDVLTPRPLEGKVLDVESVGDEELRSFLAGGGFTILDDLSHLRRLSRQSEAGKKIIAVSCDAVVVGSGSGGGVVAGVLAEAGKKVLIVEKGQYFARDDLTLLEGPSLAGMYLGGGVLATESGNVAILAGSTVGGGSAVNWSASFRTPDHVRREWAEDFGLSMFASSRYREAMDVVCSKLGVHTVCEQESFQNAVLRKGCEKMGYGMEDIPRNVTGQHSCGFCGFGCRKGAKKATSETWLVDAVNSGSRILAKCDVRGVLHRRNSKRGSEKEREAVGVVASVGKNTLLYIQARATVISAGSLCTPPLLLQSGLRNPNIGRNLHLHPVLMVWGYFPEGQGAKGVCYDGPIMSAVSKQFANWQSPSASSAYGSLIEVPILHPGSFAAVCPWISGADHKERMRKYSRTVHFLILHRDRGQGGVVKIKGKSSEITYSVDPLDVESMKDSSEGALRALVAAGAVEIGTQHLTGETFQSLNCKPEELEDYLKRVRSQGVRKLEVPMASAHQMGSCRMGANPNTSVVDGGGETWEVERLFLADASVFPTASGVNPMITVQSVAFCIAQSVLIKLEKE